eukprot:3259671-Pleurochrysis_carterae.AAC.1
MPTDARRHLGTNEARLGLGLFAVDAWVSVATVSFEFGDALLVAGNASLSIAGNAPTFRHLPWQLLWTSLFALAFARAFALAVARAFALAVA